VLQELLEDEAWQMSLGERAAVEGVLARLRPALAIEIGSAQGAALRRIASYAGEVHSFDLAPPALPQPENVTLHTGDSHELLPAFLAELAEQGRNVDFVLLDGDHSEQGVRSDLQDLLDSRALGRSVILVHDTANERVRRGIDAVRFTAWPKVVHVDLDCVAGQLFAQPDLRDELWYGLGIVVLDATVPAYRRGSVYQRRFRPAGPLLALGRALRRAGGDAPEALAALTSELAGAYARELRLQAQLGAERERCEQERRAREQERRAREQERRAREHAERMRERADRALADVMGSPSWRVTEPLRAAKRAVNRHRG
jgi:hypothetical protein